MIAESPDAAQHAAPGLTAIEIAGEAAAPGRNIVGLKMDNGFDGSMSLPPLYFVRRGINSVD
ncbi:hypothetical protein [Halorussus sp. AFM4]|uniref:hypothetical protein n=1 Tax=Halorussus sp. AFM4 TaxID=3421651 RepID=UPI003EB894AF